MAAFACLRVALLSSAGFTRATRPRNAFADVALRLDSGLGRCLLVRRVFLARAVIPVGLVLMFLAADRCRLHRLGRLGAFTGRIELPVAGHGVSPKSVSTG